jgi:hypothetical protein
LPTLREHYIKSKKCQKNCKQGFNDFHFFKEKLKFKEGKSAKFVIKWIELRGVESEKQLAIESKDWHESHKKFI